MLGKIEGRRRPGATEDEMVGWHHWLSGPEFEQTRGNSEGKKPDRLQSMGLQRVGHDLATEQNIKISGFKVIYKSVISCIPAMNK